jgi:hypothetical protein
MDFSSLPRYPVDTGRGGEPRPRKPTSRLYRLGCVAAVAWLGLTAASIWWARPWAAIGPYTYYRIRLGMTYDEVERIIGLPPGPDSRAPGLSQLVYPVAQSGTRAAGPTRYLSPVWSDDDFQIGVALDENRVVVGKSLDWVPRP